jgi:hypothetical protein
MNQELYNNFKSPDFVTIIKVLRMEWLEHVVRMDGKNRVQELLEDKTGEGRKKGRPRLRQMDDRKLG